MGKHMRVNSPLIFVFYYSPGKENSNSVKKILKEELGRRYPEMQCFEEVKTQNGEDKLDFLLST